MNEEYQQPIPVHIRGTDVPMGAGKPQRVTRTSYVTVSSAASDGNGVITALPQSDKRVRALLIPHGLPGQGNPNTCYGWLSGNKSEVAKQQGAFIEGTGQGPLELFGTGPVYFQADPASSTALYMTIIAEYCE